MRQKVLIEKFLTFQKSQYFRMHQSFQCTKLCFRMHQTSIPYVLCYLPSSFLESISLQITDKQYFRMHQSFQCTKLYFRMHQSSTPYVLCYCQVFQKASVFKLLLYNILKCISLLGLPNFILECISLLFPMSSVTAKDLKSISLRFPMSYATVKCFKKHQSSNCLCTVLQYFRMHQSFQSLSFRLLYSVYNENVSYLVEPHFFKKHQSTDNHTPLVEMLSHLKIGEPTLIYFKINGHVP